MYTHWHVKRVRTVRAYAWIYKDVSLNLVFKMFRQDLFKYALHVARKILENSWIILYAYTETYKIFFTLSWHITHRSIIPGTSFFFCKKKKYNKSRDLLNDVLYVDIEADTQELMKLDEGWNSEEENFRIGEISNLKINEL